MKDLVDLPEGHKAQGTLRTVGRVSVLAATGSSGLWLLVSFWCQARGWPWGMSLADGTGWPGALGTPPLLPVMRAPEFPP